MVTTESTPRECGDEPLQFKTKFPDVEVAVDSDRVNGVVNIFKNAADTECILLDDAYQHRAILPSYNILLTEYGRPFFKDWMLPTGNLREWPVGKKRANTIIVTKCPEKLTDAEVEDFHRRIAPTPDQRLYFSTFKYGSIHQMNGTHRHSDLTDLSEHDIVLVTGIANPEPLVRKMDECKLNFKHLKFPDHHRFSSKDIEKIRNLFDTFGDRKIILTTEKDAQRLKSLEAVKELPVYYLTIEVAFLNNGQTFREEILAHVRNNKVDSGIFK